MPSSLPAPTLPERAVLRTLWALGRVGLGGLVTRFYLWMLSTVGPTMMPRVFRGYVPTAHDVFVCTYAKSGTNWMMQIVVQILYRGRAEFGHIHELVPWPEAPVPSQVVPLADARPGPTGRRAIKTHVPHPHVPLAPEARYVVVVRDPKEVFVSSFHFIGGIIEGIWGSPPDLDAWTARWMEDRFPTGSWAEHTAGWWSVRDAPHVLFLTFAELKRDLPGCVARVAGFLDVALTDAELEAVVERSTFAWMKAHEDCFATPVPSVMGSRAAMIRSGKSGASGELIDAELRARIDAISRERLARLAPDLPYDEVFGALRAPRAHAGAPPPPTAG